MHLEQFSSFFGTRLMLGQLRSGQINNAWITYAIALEYVDVYLLHVSMQRLGSLGGPETHEALPR